MLASYILMLASYIFRSASVRPACGRLPRDSNITNNMERRKKLFLAKSVLIAGVIPILIYAYEFGPDPGYCGVPGENGTCAQSGCNVGTVNSGQGSVAVTFPNGQTCAPGVKEHLMVTISDPATTQQAWGFQLTARSSTNTQAQAGSFVPSDANTQVLCTSVTLAGIVSGTAQGCPTSVPLAYIEHTLAGVQKTLGQKGSATYEFDWKSAIRVGLFASPINAARFQHRQYHHLPGRKRGPAGAALHAE